MEKNFHLTEIDKLIIQKFPLAHIVTDLSSLQGSYLPVLYNFDESNDFLLGHFDINNEQFNRVTSGDRVYLHFHGPQGYISPSWYMTKRFPTWHYANLSVSGQIYFFQDDEKLEKLLLDMTQVFEHATEGHWQLRGKEDSMRSQLKKIRGFTVFVEKCDRSFKLGEDLSVEDRESLLNFLDKKNSVLANFERHYYNISSKDPY